MTLADLKKAYEQDSDDASDPNSDADDDFDKEGFAKPKKSTAPPSKTKTIDPLDLYDDEGNLKEAPTSATATQVEGAASQVEVCEESSLGLADYEDEVRES